MCKYLHLFFHRNFLNCLIDFWHHIFHVTSTLHTPRFRLFRKDQLWHVSCYWVSVNIMLSSIMEIYAFQLARFEILLETTLLDFSSRREQRDKVIYIKERIYSKLVIKNGAFNTLRYETPHLRCKLKSSSTPLKTVIKMLCKRIMRNLLCFHFMLVVGGFKQWWLIEHTKRSSLKVEEFGTVNILYFTLLMKWKEWLLIYSKSRERAQPIKKGEFPRTPIFFNHYLQLKISHPCQMKLGMRTNKKADEKWRLKL